MTASDEKALLDDIHTTLRLGFNGVRKHQKLEDPRFLYWADRLGLLVSSEFAGTGYVKPGDQVPPDAWGYSGLEIDAQHATARLRDLYNALKQMPNIIGFCFTQLTDVEQEVNGLLTYDRQPKFDASEVKLLNDSLP